MNEKEAWPFSIPFSSAYACKSQLPYGKISRFQNVLFNPITNLLPNFGTSLLVPIVSWALFIGLYFFVRDAAPLCFLNSLDKQYINTSRCILSTFVLYYLVSMIFVSLLFTNGCKQSEELAELYLAKLNE